MNVLVCIPVLNGEKYIEKTLVSLCLQTFSCRIVVIDNGSIDETQKICSYFKGKIEYHYVGKSATLGESLNRALSFKDECDVLVVAHADDIYQPNYLMRMVENLEEDPSIDILHTRAGIIDENGDKIVSLKNYFRIVVNSIFPRLESRWGIALLLLKNTIIAPTVAFRSSSVGNYRFSEKNTFLTDLSLWIRCLSDGKLISFVREELVLYRVHGQQQSNLYTDTSQRNIAYKQLREDHNFTKIEEFIIKLNTFIYGFIKKLFFTNRLDAKK